MSAYKTPTIAKTPRLKKNQIQLIANGDLRLSANQKCWPAQRDMEQALAKAVAAAGDYELVRAHPYKADEQHGFIGSQKEGMSVFATIDPDAPLIVAEAVWQYSHHVLHGLISHRGPILTVANWSGTWPGLVGMLNLNGSLTKAGVKYSTLWSEKFADEFFTGNLAKWLKTGQVKHKTDHVVKFEDVKVGRRRSAGWASRWQYSFSGPRRSWACSTRAAWGCSTRSSPTNCSTPRVFSRSGSASRPCITRRRRSVMMKPMRCGSGWKAAG